jgi:hypothetical protein
MPSWRLPHSRKTACGLTNILEQSRIEGRMRRSTRRSTRRTAWRIPQMHSLHALFRQSARVMNNNLNQHPPSHCISPRTIPSTHSSQPRAGDRRFRRAVTRRTSGRSPPLRAPAPPASRHRCDGVRGEERDGALGRRPTGEEGRGSCGEYLAGATLGMREGCALLTGL